MESGGQLVGKSCNYLSLSVAERVVLTTNAQLLGPHSDASTGMCVTVLIVCVCVCVCDKVLIVCMCVCVCVRL